MKKHNRLILCIILGTAALACSMLPKQEIDYYADYYNMAPVTQTGSGCRVYIGTIPEIRWQGYDGFDNYQFQVSTDAGFTALLVDETNLAAPVYTFNTPLVTAGSYYYRFKYTTPGGNWSNWTEAVQIKLYRDNLLEDFEVLPDNAQAVLPWVVEGKVKLDTSEVKSGNNSLKLTVDSKQEAVSLTTEVYCADYTPFSIWLYYNGYNSNFLLKIDGVPQSNNITYSWKFFSNMLSPGYHTIEFNHYIDAYSSSSNNYVYLDNMQFTYYGEKPAAFFSSLGTALTSYEFFQNYPPQFIEEPGVGLCLQMGQYLTTGNTKVTLEITAAASGWLAFFYIVNKGFYYEGTFKVSCNSHNYYNSNNYMSSWNSLVLPLVAGQNTITLDYDKNSDDAAAVTSVRGFRFLSVLDGFESGNLTNLPWTTSGTLPVTVQNTTKNEGVYAAQIGNSTPNDTGSGSLQLTLTLAEEAVIYFDCMFNSYRSNQLRFNIDNTLSKQWDYSSSMQWYNYNYRLSAGSHTLNWIMDDNYSASAYQAWVDNIRISTTNYTSP